MNRMIFLCVIIIGFIYANQSKSCETSPAPIPSPTETPLLTLQLVRGD